MLLAAMPAAAIAAKIAPLAPRRLRVEVSRLEKSLKETLLVEARIMLAPPGRGPQNSARPRMGGARLRSGLAG
jgi:hypothetical protein